MVFSDDFVHFLKIRKKKLNSPKLYCGFNIPTINVLKVERILIQTLSSFTFLLLHKGVSYNMNNQIFIMVWGALLMLFSYIVCSTSKYFKWGGGGGGQESNTYKLYFYPSPVITQRCMFNNMNKPTIQYGLGSTYCNIFNKFKAALTSQSMYLLLKVEGILTHVFWNFSVLLLCRGIYTERQKKLITSSGRCSLVNLIIFGHKLALILLNKNI